MTLRKVTSFRFRGRRRIGRRFVKIVHPNASRFSIRSAIFGRPSVKRFALYYRTVYLFGPASDVGVYQTAGWIKMPLGTEVGLGPGDIVFDGDPAPP